jgi:hypothetical protein
MAGDRFVALAMTTGPNFVARMKQSGIRATMMTLRQQQKPLRPLSLRGKKSFLFLPHTLAQ